MLFHPEVCFLIKLCLMNVGKQMTQNGNQWSLSWFHNHVLYSSSQIIITITTITTTIITAIIVFFLIKFSTAILSVFVITAQLKSMHHLTSKCPSLHKGQISPQCWLHIHNAVVKRKRMSKKYPDSHWSVTKHLCLTPFPQQSFLLTIVHLLPHCQNTEILPQGQAQELTNHRENFCNEQWSFRFKKLIPD